jgi:hypothetical protein
MSKPSLSIVWLSAIVTVILLMFFWGYMDKRSNQLDPEVAYCNGTLSECVGKKIKFFGTTTNEQFQHTSYPSGSYTEESLLANKRYGVVVIYTQSPLNVPNNTALEVVGTVVDASVAPQAGSKAEAGSRDYQILVDEWKLWKIQ